MAGQEEEERPLVTYISPSVHPSFELPRDDPILADDVHHRAPTAQTVPVLPAQQRLARHLEQLLRLQIRPPQALTHAHQAFRCRPGNHEVLRRLHGPDTVHPAQVRRPVRLQASNYRLYEIRPKPLLVQRRRHQLPERRRLDVPLFAKTIQVVFERKPLGEGRRVRGQARQAQEQAIVDLVYLFVWRVKGRWGEGVGLGVVPSSEPVEDEETRRRGGGWRVGAGVVVPVPESDGSGQASEQKPKTTTHGRSRSFGAERRAEGPSQSRRSFCPPWRRLPTRCTRRWTSCVCFSYLSAVTSVACSSARRGAFEILSTTDPAEFSLSRDALRANESVRARMTRERFKFAYGLVLFVVFVCRSLANVMKRGVLQSIRQIKILLGTHAPPPHDRHQTGDGRTSTKLRRHTTHDTRHTRDASQGVDGGRRPGTGRAADLVRLPRHARWAARIQGGHHEERTPWEQEEARRVRRTGALTLLGPVGCMSVGRSMPVRGERGPVSGSPGAGCGPRDDQDTRQVSARAASRSWWPAARHASRPNPLVRAIRSMLASSKHGRPWRVPHELWSSGHAHRRAEKARGIGVHHSGERGNRTTHDSRPPPLRSSLLAPRR